MTNHTNMNIYEIVSKLRPVVRFDSPRGPLTAEDLWDLPLSSTRANVPNLDDVAKETSRQLKATAGEESFVNPTINKDADVLNLKLDVLKHIIAVKQFENATKVTEAAAREQRQKLLELLDAKKDERLNTLTEYQIRLMLEGKTLDEVIAIGPNPAGTVSNVAESSVVTTLPST